MTDYLLVIEKNKTVISEKYATDIKGIRHWYRVIKAPLYKKIENMSGLVTIVENIDAEKQNAEQQELFLAELTHDLKNPILAQISCLEMMLKGSFGALPTGILIHPAAIFFLFHPLYDMCAADYIHQGKDHR